jgi:hypothetical protein
MNDLEILERKIMLKYQLLSLINEDIEEMEIRRRDMQIRELEEKKRTTERLEAGN